MRGDIRSLQFQDVAEQISALPLTTLKIRDWDRTLLPSFAPLWPTWSGPLEHLTLSANEATSILELLPRPLASLTIVNGDGYKNTYCDHRRTLSAILKLLQTSQSPAVLGFNQLILRIIGSHNRAGRQTICKQCNQAQSTASKVRKLLEERGGELVQLRDW